MQKISNRDISVVCNSLQDSLYEFFWDEDKNVFKNHYPELDSSQWIYWWQAHALDALIDAYLRTENDTYLSRAEDLYKGVLQVNGGTFLHNWYDDMEWMALAILRLWDVEPKTEYKDQVYIIWEDIKTAWNKNCGGGLAWKKDQLDYKNTPANAPAAILAFRLFQRFKNEEDLSWGIKILDWNLQNLMDPETAFVWDGMNRLGDGQIDYDWKYSYNQGVVIGALVEQYRITGEDSRLDLASKIVEASLKNLADPKTFIFPYEGKDDCGLFRGIFFRYLYQLISVSDRSNTLIPIIMSNSEVLIQYGINENNLVGGDWLLPQEGTIDLAQHLSGVMLLEVASLATKRIMT